MYRKSANGRSNTGEREKKKERAERTPFAKSSVCAFIFRKRLRLLSLRGIEKCAYGEEEAARIQISLTGLSFPHTIPLNALYLFFFFLLFNPFCKICGFLFSFFFLFSELFGYPRTKPLLASSSCVYTQTEIWEEKRGSCVGALFNEWRNCVIVYALRKRRRRKKLKEGFRKKCVARKVFLRRIRA